MRVAHAPFARNNAGGPANHDEEFVLHIRSVFIAAMSSLSLCAPAFAQDADETPEWQGEGSLSAGYTTGNTETTDFGAGLKLKHNGDLWSQSGEFKADYGETDSIETKNRIAAAGQVDRIITDRLSGYGRVTYERDEFSGFENRYFVGGGLSYDILIDEPTTWTVQGGPGYRVDEIRGTGDTEESLGFAAGSRLAHDFNENVALTNDTDIIYSNTSTQITNSLALTFELLGDLSARISYDVRHDTDPPAGFESTDTATKFSLVYKIG